MENDKLLPALFELLNKDFAVARRDLPEKRDYNRELEELRKFLSERVAILMSEDFDRFVNSLYRIDIPENKIRKVFNDKSNPDLSGKIADLIIERQLQRAKTRLLYKEGKL
ncbi:MAG: hypothetical protein SCALA702_21160 [Melioribacteraceae bacterium]|nr:MAG: hypothetical protein SCALA702_21160 [Melioribacteraceae bacterium]